MKNLAHSLLVVCGLLLGLAACSDDTCTLVCPEGEFCTADNGVESCTGTSDGSCTGCTEGQHCVAGVCVDNYTAENVCDPLRQCREGCGTNVRCLDACLADGSATCTSCLNRQTSCESDQNCDANAASCCETQFCACFPSAPGCNGVAACLECQEDCGDSTSCFNTCRAEDIVCNQCLQTFDQCAEENGAPQCSAEFCGCLDPALTEGCE